MQFHAVVGEIQIALARSSEDGRARGWTQRFGKMTIGRVPGLDQIRCGGMNIVKKIKDKTLCDWRRR